MNVTILYQGRYPGPNASSKRIANYIRLFSSIGLSAVVSNQYIHGNKRISTYFKSIFLFISLSKDVLKLASHNKVLLIYGFNWFEKLCIIFFGRLSSQKIILEINEKPFTVGGSRRDKFLKYLIPLNRLFLHHLVFRNAHGIIVISEALEKYVKKYISNKTYVLKLPILISKDEYKKEYPIPSIKTPYFIHTATPNDYKDGIIAVFKAFAIIITKYKLDLDFHLTSRRTLPEVKNEINFIIKKHNLEERVIFHDNLDEELLKRMQAHSLFAVINKTNIEQNKYNFATKIGEYLIVGTPIITSNLGESGKYLIDGVNCIEIQANNPENIAQKMKTLIENPQYRDRLGIKGKETAERNFEVSLFSSDLEMYCRKLEII